MSLDDGVVYTAPANFHADDRTVVYDHSAAPGRHAVTIEVERRDDRDDSFRTTQRSRFVVDIPRDNRMGRDVRISDDSNMVVASSGADLLGPVRAQDPREGERGRLSRR